MKKILILTCFLCFTNYCTAQVMEEEIMEAPPSPSPQIEYEIEDEPEIEYEIEDEPAFDFGDRNKSKFTSGIHPYSVGELKGLKDYGTGEILVDANFRYVDTSYAGLVKLSGDNNAGVFDIEQRKVVIPFEYAHLDIIRFKKTEDGKQQYVFKVRKDYKNPSNGFIDQHYNIIVPTVYDQIDFWHDHLVLRRNKKMGVRFLTAEKQEIPEIYDGITVAAEQHFIARQDGVYTLFNEDGKPIFSEQKHIQRFEGCWEARSRDYLLLEDKSAKYGLYHLSSKKMILPQEYDFISDKFHGFHSVKKNGAHGIVDENNKTVLPFKYDAVSFLKISNVGGPMESRNIERDKMTLIAVAKNGKYGLMNRAGQAITKIKYDEVEHLFGFYAVKEKDKYSVLDPAGNQISDQVFDAVGHFSNGKAAVFNEGQMTYLKQDGTLEAPFTTVLYPKGYKTIDELYSELVGALKSDDDNLLLEFSIAAVPDPYSLEYMKRIGLSYRGIPKEMSKRGFTSRDIADKFFEKMVYLRDELKRKDELTSLEYVGYEMPITGVPYQGIADHILVQGIEEAGVLKTNKKTFEYKLGELLNIDGYWKSFTSPRKGSTFKKK